MSKYHLKEGLFSSTKRKYLYNIRPKYRRGAASLILRKYINLRKGSRTSLIVPKPTFTEENWILNTNTSYEERKLLSQETQQPSNADYFQKLRDNVSPFSRKRRVKIKKLMSHVMPKSPLAEAFRILRTNVSFSALKGANKIILITSPGPGEGKTTVASNLGIVMAQAHSRVLIVDCDLRKPMMHTIFNLEKTNGLTNLLVQELDPEEVINTTEIKGLHVIASGPIPPNPSELLGSSKMAMFLSRIAEQYDVILLDAPPVIAVTDSVLLVPMADMALLVLKANATRIDMAREARNRLIKANPKSIGVVINEAKIHGRDYNNYYYYGTPQK